MGYHRDRPDRRAGEQCRGLWPARPDRDGRLERSGPRALAINLNGSVLMARAVVPGMKALGRGAIIQVSGGGATNPLPGISAYAASKAAVVRFAETLALEVKPFGITVNALAPGALNTRMLEEIIAAGPERVGAVFHERALQQQNSGGTPARQGCRGGDVSRLGGSARHHRTAGQCGLGQIRGLARSS